MLVHVVSGLGEGWTESASPRMRHTDRRRGPQAAQFIHSLNSSSHNLGIDSETHLQNGGSEVGNDGLVELAFFKERYTVKVGYE